MFLLLQLEASISYLEFCVNKLKNEDRAIHNFLISTYVMSRNEPKLLAYLNEQSKVRTYNICCNGTVTLFTLRVIQYSVEY